MKNLTTLLIASILSLAAYSQELMTIGEVFGFEIGDEFQIRGSATGQPPNADWITIIGKEYSTAGDTVFYHRYHDSYLIYIEGGTGHYYFYTKTDTIFYTHLDSTIAFYDQDFQCERYFENPANLCFEQINGYYCTSGNGFEDDVWSKEYGKGLGMTKNYFYSGLGQTVDYNNVLFYYKKGDFTCGTPDLTVGILETDEATNEFLVFPNPATSVLNIENKSINTEFSIVLQNSIGQQVMAAGLNEKTNKLDISNLPPGIYLLQIRDSNGTVFNHKILKQD